MPLENWIKNLVLATALTFVAAVALFGVYASFGAISFGHVLIDPLVYIGAFVLVVSFLIAALVLECVIVSHVILWGTYVDCRMDRRRPAHLRKEEL